MRVLVTGTAGQLGHDVMNELSRRGIEGIGSDLAPLSGETSGQGQMPYVSLDITDQEQVRTVFREWKPDALIHCAAWTAVDAAEDKEKQGTVHAVNVDGTRHLAVCYP